VISYAQLYAAGETRASIRTMISEGQLLRAAPHVLRTGTAPVSLDSARWIAVLATDGVLVGSSAAQLWGMVDEVDGPITVAVRSGRAVKAPRGVRVVRSDRMVTRATTRSGLPVSARSDAALEHVIALGRIRGTEFADRALQRRWLTTRDLDRRLDQKAPGNAVLRQVRSTLEVGAEAESERMLHQLLREAGLSGWTANPRLVIAGQVVRPDIVFEKLKLAIEADGFRYHSKSGRYQHDRTRQNALVLAGWMVLRFTWEDLTERPQYVVDQIRAAISAAA